MPTLPEISTEILALSAVLSYRSSLGVFSLIPQYHSWSFVPPLFLFMNSAAIAESEPTSLIMAACSSPVFTFNALSSVFDLSALKPASSLKTHFGLHSLSQLMAVLQCDCSSHTTSFPLNSPQSGGRQAPSWQP